MAKKLLAAALAAACLLLFACAGGSGNEADKKLVITDSEGNELAVYVTGEESPAEKGYASYIGAAISEASGIIVSLGIAAKENAAEELLAGGYIIETAFVPQVAEAIKNAAESQLEPGTGFGAAATDLQGRLIASYDTRRDLAFTHTAPYSSFKPLSVYAIAIDRGIACWSTSYPDSPVKQVAREDGSYSDWPANADGNYSRTDVTLPKAIMRSLNTVAVRCMQEVGVLNSLDFLRDSFGRDFASERTRAELYGEEEVIGNCALGYLYDGVSPAEMAGYYQIFADGGVYYEPKTVMRITRNGEEIYKYVPQGKRVIKESTAFIMNRLLRESVLPGGTGGAARVDGMEVGGKTGSGDNGYWFVGFTPGCTCAVWHDTVPGHTLAPAVFAAAVSAFPASGANYPECAGVRQMLYCTDTGLLSYGRCPRTAVGYFAEDDLPEYCKEH
ncbi:MAG: penicillin-binding protein [Clostridia bacterium]|nr:penicillin-binding protein [Clostridia bacterium]